MSHVAPSLPPIWFPNQRIVRTVLQSVASTFVTLAGVVGFLAMFAPQLLEAVREVLPASWHAWGVLAVGTIGTVSGVLARIMAIPAVDAFLARFGAGSVPRREIRSRPLTQPSSVATASDFEGGRAGPSTGSSEAGLTGLRERRGR